MESVQLARRDLADDLATKTGRYGWTLAAWWILWTLAMALVWAGIGCMALPLIAALLALTIIVPIWGAWLLLQYAVLFSATATEAVRLRE